MAGFVNVTKPSSREKGELESDGVSRVSAAVVPPQPLDYARPESGTIDARLGRTVAVALRVSTTSAALSTTAW